MNGWLHTTAGITILYLPRKEDKGGLISAEDCVNLARVDIEFYVRNSG